MGTTTSITVWNCCRQNHRIGYSFILLISFHRPIVCYNEKFHIILKKNAELTIEKQKAAKAAAAAKKAGQKPPANPNAKRAAAIAKKGKKPAKKTGKK